MGGFGHGSFVYPRPMRVGRGDVAVTNLEKVFFPVGGLTKGDLIRYYVDLATHVLNHVERRPMQMKRYPNGVERRGECRRSQRRDVEAHSEPRVTLREAGPGPARDRAK
jgi:DNA primase